MRLEAGKAEDQTEGQSPSPELKWKTSSQSLLMGKEEKLEGQTQVNPIRCHLEVSTGGECRNL